MKKYLLLLLVLLCCCYGNACTTFLLSKDGKLMFGRNYDWITGAGIVNTNQRGLFKTAAEKNQKTMSWVSLYGSITFNQYGKEFPTGGMNEKGLVVELMWLDGTKYPATDQRPAVGVLQWIQYQLDMHATVDDIINSDKKIRISDEATPLHFLIADAKGNAATIEFLHAKMVVHKDNQLPFAVLTNDTYAKSITAVEQTNATGDMPGNNSLDRFVTACKMVDDVKTVDSKLPLQDYAFSILDKVSQGDFTKWSIVYDISNKKVYFKTADFQSVKSFSLNSFDFNCTATAKMFNINQAVDGDIAAKFTLPNKTIKRAVLEKAIKESQEYVTISETEKKLLLEFEERIKCGGKSMK
jgi:penicillin V acylase-like amidase (Ntn superfamily)